MRDPEMRGLTSAITMHKSSFPRKFNILDRTMRRRITATVAIATVMIAQRITPTAEESSLPDILETGEKTKLL
jgi:hypothetical protein